MKPFSIFSRPFLFVLTLLFGSLVSTAQNVEKQSLASRISVNVEADKTSIWISDFPKNVSLVLFDENYELISIVSSNDFGAGFVRIPKSIHSRIFAKTINGEIVVASFVPEKKEIEVAAVESKETSKS